MPPLSPAVVGASTVSIAEEINRPETVLLQQSILYYVAIIHLGLRKMSCIIASNVINQSPIKY